MTLYRFQMRRLAFNFSALKQAITMTFERLSVRAFLLADVGLTDVELTYIRLVLQRIRILSTAH